jgi:endoglucanase
MRSFARLGLLSLHVSLTGAVVACGGAVGEEPSTSSWEALLADGESLSVASDSTSAASNRNCSNCSVQPLAYWRFDDCNTQTTELADTGYATQFAHPAFRTVSTACVAGRSSQAVQLSNTEDLVYSPDQPDYDFSQGLTIAAWINPDANWRTQNLIRKRLDGTSSFALAIESGRIEFVVRLTNKKVVGVSALIKAGQFSHVAGTYDGQQVRLYVNGTVVAQANGVGSIAQGVGPIFIGNDANGRRFKGIVDEVWLNNLAAPADTIKGLNCVRLPPVVTISPGTTPPEQANTPVAFDIGITNPNDAAMCPTDVYELYPSLPYPLQSDSYDSLVSVTPGQTVHRTANIYAEDTGTGGEFTFAYYVYNTANYSLPGASAQATYVVAPPASPTPTGCPASPTQPVAPGGYYVNGNTMCTADGREHRLHGLARPSLEWLTEGANLSLADFQRMASWNANVVRIALNQDFWLSDSPLADPYYPAVVDDAITWAGMAGMDVILDLHWSDTGVLGSCLPSSAGCQQMMPDVNSASFWNQVATRYKNNGRVMFELYNEPHDVAWEVWKNGGQTSAGWLAVGMQQLYDTVRATGAQNLVLVGGLDWAYDLSGVPNYRISGYNIAYATHPYGPYRDPSDWGRAWGSLTYTDPVVATEFGVLNDTGCTTDYAAQVMQFADAHLASWTAWAWYPGGCTFPGLITDWSGSPSALGDLVKSALLRFNDPPASLPLPSTGGPDVNFTFDRQPQGWAFNTYDDPTNTNIVIHVPSGGTAPTLTLDTTTGNPGPGALKLSAPFTAFDQNLDVQVAIDQPGLDLTGKTLHGWVRLVSGSISGGGVRMHASTGSNSIWAGGSWIDGTALESGDWVPLTFDLGAVTTSGFEPSKVILIGVQFYSGFASSGGTFTANGPAVFEIDTVAD